MEMARQQKLQQSVADSLDKKRIKEAELSKEGIDKNTKDIERVSKEIATKRNNLQAKIEETQQQSQQPQ